MPRPPTTSPATGKEVPSHYIHSSSAHFQDTHGRSLLLRGVNLSGSAKAPHGQPSYCQSGLWDEAEAGRGDFVGRPLDLEDGSADIHLARLRAWGYNILRFVFIWEALEHSGPGKYDMDYVEYVVRCLKKCKEWGFRVFMDPHQDVWSRFSGGSGAPIWTLYACGIDPLHQMPTSSALLHCEWPSRSDPKPHTFPQMLWATNYTRLTNQTVWTLFFAGKTYAPKCTIDGVNIQDWLQDRFIDAVSVLAKRVAAEPGLLDEVVIGWDSINEPGEGLIGAKNLAVVPKDQRLKKGTTPSPFEGMRLAMGQAVEVDSWKFLSMGPKYAGKVLLDPKGTRLWLKPEEEDTRGGGKWGWKRGDQWEMGTCIWAQHGVWDPSTSKLLKPDYFATYPTDPSRTVDMVNDFWSVHWAAYASRIRLHHPEAIQFVQPPVFAVPPALPRSLLKDRLCLVPHYYDGLTLMTKHWNWFNADALGVCRHKYWSVLQSVKVGEKAIRRSIQDQLGILKQDTKDVYGDFPTLIGEIGCPFDLDDKRAYGDSDGVKGEGDYSQQQRAWDASMNAMDGLNCLNYTMWTYVLDNSHEWGDLWNGEDLSIFSPDDMDKTEVFVDSGKNASATTMTVSPAPGAGHENVIPSKVANSTTSSQTLALSSTQPLTRRSVESGEGVSAALILAGSRAVAATCRPYPTATVGTPERIDLDIASSTFRLQVRVRPDDVCTKDNVTEVYLPFVHYAASLSPRSISSQDQPGSSKISLPLPKNGTESSKLDPLKLDIEVRVSAGTYEFAGQTLRWTYPSPSAGEATYTLEVKRRGGALRREAGYVQQGDWGDVCPSCVIG